jgi:type II secretory pathway predicted ATPase ExeA
MMEQTWGFTRPPFTKDLALSDYFLSQQFREFTARLQIMVETRALGLVTGEIGSGKSCGIRYLAAQLDPAQTPMVYVAESQLTPFDFYA